MVGVAVNVTLLPEHVGFAPDVIAMLTVGVTELFTVAVTSNLVMLSHPPTVWVA